MTVSWPSQDDLLMWLESDLNNWGRWGKDDQKGTLNHLSPEKTLQAVSLVSEGVTVSCARPVEFAASVDVPKPPQQNGLRRLAILLVLMVFRVRPNSAHGRSVRATRWSLRDELATSFVVPGRPRKIS